MKIEKWAMAGLFSALLAVVLGSIFAGGFTEENIRLALRITARTSVVLFLLAFGASSFHALSRNDVSTYFLRNRRYVGVTFAISHFAHLAFIIALAAIYPEPFFSQTGAAFWIVGGATYVFIAAMTITSFDTPRRAISAKNWSRLHTSGGYLILFVFAQAYIPSAFTKGGVYIPIAIAIAAVFSVRMHRLYINKRGSV